LGRAILLNTALMGFFVPSASTLGLAQKRVIAKAETINPIAALFTPNDLAKTGIAGMTIPKPTATKKDAAIRIDTSRGRSLKGERIKLEILLPLLHVLLRNL
jgi:predicted P-loop ATPase/GTPase